MSTSKIVRTPLPITELIFKISSRVLEMNIEVGSIRGFKQNIIQKAVALGHSHSGILKAFLISFLN